MNRTERIRADRHPIADLLREQGRSQAWLARRIGRTHEHTNRVLNGIHPASPDFRARCAAELGLPVADLFHGDGASSASPSVTPNGGSMTAALARGA